MPGLARCATLSVAPSFSFPRFQPRGIHTFPRMNQKLIAEIGKSQRLAIINRLKRTRGLSVSEIAAQLDMSYMGIKQHCVELHKGGYLDTWRRPKPVGRPELVYRLTNRVHELFPVASNAMTIDLLQAAAKLYGPAAAEKLLFTMFQRKGERYLAKLKGTTLGERAQSLAKLRDVEGCMADLESSRNGTVWRIIENHSPILDVLRAFPIVARLETELFQRVLQARVEREEVSIAGLYRCTFHVA